VPRGRRSGPAGVTDGPRRGGAPAGARRRGGAWPGAAWLVGLPLAGGAWLTAHELAYELVPPAGHERMHHYLEALPVLLACGLTLLLVGVAAALRRGAGGRPAPRLALRPALLVPLLGFVVQEHLERAIAGGGLPLEAALEPAFGVGLALQVPFALAALAVARAMIAWVHAVGAALRALAPGRWLPVWPEAVPRRAAVRIDFAARAPLALGHGQRAPPVASRPRH
jgi:hypothetical protein